MKVLHVFALLSLVLIFGAKVKYVDSTSQSWVAGIYEAGYGTDYRICLLAKGGSEKLQVDELWIGEDYFKVKAVKDLAYRNNLSFEKRDTIYVASSIKYKPGKDGKMEQVKLIKKEAPKKFSGDALLGYTWKGKKNFLEITKFRKLEKIIYP